jgi:glycosyltransferase involved in cell wall biosynthesis
VGFHTFASLPYLPGAEFVALAFGTIRENKGTLLAIQAVQRLRKEGVPLRLRVAGRPYASEMHYWERCKHVIAKAPDGIDVWEGFVPDSAIPTLVQPAHFFILPYSGFSSQSGVALLAFWLGRAVIATGEGGLAALVVDGTNGFRISGTTLEQVQEALRRGVAAGHPTLARMGAAAASQVRVEADPRVLAKRHLACYANASGGHDASLTS